jgi:hypothetical protein
MARGGARHGFWPPLRAGRAPRPEGGAEPGHYRRCTPSGLAARRDQKRTKSNGRAWTPRPVVRVGTQSARAASIPPPPHSEGPASAPGCRRGRHRVCHGLLFRGHRARGGRKRPRRRWAGTGLYSRLARAEYRGRARSTASSRPSSLRRRSSVVGCPVGRLMGLVLAEPSRRAHPGRVHPRRPFPYAPPPAGTTRSSPHIPCATAHLKMPLR